MLNHLERLAQRLAFLKIPALLLAAAGLLHFVLTLQLPGILLVFWALLLYSFLNLFQHLPAAAQPNQGFFERLKMRVHRSGYWLLLIVFVFLTLAILMMTLRGLLLFFSS